MPDIQRGASIRPHVYVSIGNTDGKLSQDEWAGFIADVESACEAAGNLHGAWFSRPDAPWVNACWCVELIGDAHWLRAELTGIAARYRQDSIAWTEAVTEFLSPAEMAS